jgi:hypothetical protein
MGNRLYELHLFLFLQTLIIAQISSMTTAMSRITGRMNVSLVFLTATIIVQQNLIQMEHAHSKCAHSVVIFLGKIMILIGHAISIPGKTCPDGYDYSKSKTAIRYQRMRDALLKVNRNILYSLCEWGEMKVELWGNDTAMSWRSTGDIQRKLFPMFALAN